MHFWIHPLTDWRASLVAAGRPSTTVRLRLYQLRRFAEDHAQPWKVTDQDMVHWLASRNWSVESRKSYRAALRGFYRWAQQGGLIERDPSHLLPPIRSLPHPPRPAPDSVIRRAVLAAGPREHLMVTLGYRQGLRRGEIARIHSDDLREDLAGWSLLVHGKGGRERLVPLADDVAGMLRTLPKGWAFPSPYGGHLTEQHVGKLIARVMPDGWTAHPLRHRFATTAYAGTRDLLAVQELLGHSRPETTRQYIQMPQDALRTAVSAAA